LSRLNISKFFEIIDNHLFATIILA